MNSATSEENSNSAPENFPSYDNDIQVADMDNDGLLESYILSDGILTISEYNELEIETSISTSDTLWIDSFVLEDVTHDGKPNIVLSVWKEGSFGDAEPFWEEGLLNDTIGNHLFVYTLTDNTLTPVWQSSELGVPNCAIATTDTNNDGRKELIVLEGSYDSFPDCTGKYIAIWEWKEWGFVNIWRSSAGSYQDLSVTTTGSISATKL